MAFSYDVHFLEKSKDNLLIMPYSFVVARVHFSTLNSREAYYSWILERVESLNYKRIILSATTSVDLRECYLLQEFLRIKGISCDIVQINSVNELVELYESTKLLISGRMHALIIGGLCGIEWEAIEVSPKIVDYKDAFMKSENLIPGIKKMSLDGLERLWEILTFEEK